MAPLKVHILRLCFGFFKCVMYYWLFSFDLNIVLKKFKAKEQDHIRLGYIIGIVSLFGIRGSKRGFKTRVRKKKRDDWNLIPFVTKGRNFQRAVSLTMLFFYHMLSGMGSTQFVLFLRFKQWTNWRKLQIYFIVLS